MGIWAILAPVVVGIVLGFLAQIIGQARSGHDWAIAAVGAVLGAFVAGQYLGAITTWGPQFDGLYVVPAVLGAIVVATSFEAVVRITAPAAIVA